MSLLNNTQGVGIKELHRRVKTAMHYPAGPLQDQAKQTAARQLLALLGIGAAGGAGVRGLMGLRELGQSPALPVSRSANLPHTISVFGRPSHQPQEEEQPTLPMKTAVDLTPPAQPGFVEQGVDYLAKQLGPHLPDTHTLNPLANEWGIPAGVAALGGGAFGGYKLVDWLLNKQKTQQGQADVQSAEDDYRKALADQYRAAMMSKQAGDDLGINELAETYVACAEEGMTKEAFAMSAIGAAFPGVDALYSNALGYDRWQALKGGANAASLAAMLGTGKLTYDWAKGQNKQELLQKALKRRQMMRQQLSPPPIVALPEEDERAKLAA